MNNEWIHMQGNEYDILNVLQELIGLDRRGAARLLGFLERENSTILCPDETYQVTKSVSGINDNMLGLMTMHNNYYINVRVSTIFLLSTLIDAKIKLPVTAGYLAAKGMKCMVEKIDEDSGMKCILLEILRLPDKAGSSDILENFKGECCNNHLSCSFRRDNKCQCTNQNVEHLMEKLENIGILKKKEDFYYYDSIGSL